MKKKLLFSLMAGAALAASAQGYQDGVDNFNAGRMEEAKIILDNTLNDATTDKAIANYYRGCIDIKEGNTAAAKQRFDTGIAANPKYALNYVGLGELALKAGDKSAAEKYFKQALDIDKKDTEVMAYVARAYWNVDPVKYEKDIDKYIKKAFKDSKNTEPAVYVLQGDMVAGDPNQASGLYEMAIEQSKAKDEINREAYVKYAQTYFQVPIGRDYAIKRLEEFNERDPQSALAQRELAEKYYENDQLGRAWKQYEKYVQNPNHFRRDEQRYAGLLYSAEEYEKSIEWAKKVLAQDPNVFPMYRILTLNYEALKQWPEALESIEKLFNSGTTLVPNDYNLYGEALIQNNRGGDAVAIYEKAIALNPTDTSLQPKLSQAYAAAGDNAKSIEVLENYLNAGNGGLNDLYAMANRYGALAKENMDNDQLRVEDSDKAIKYIDMALEKAPGNPQLLAVKARFYLTRAKNQLSPEMAAVYEEMLKGLAEDPSRMESYASDYRTAYRNLGAYYANIKEDAKAKEYFGKYLEMDPENEQIREIYNKL
ncbi:MAG: tetratricopeptide repeat protein [Firmicutes bacterium]|nr:tetratricopeptide repeat protein [Bacillota bacterium]MCM1401134.1 tetratricopeptide repeat protein [Bacteroides sp.]MCM1477043.1 tetratricopeptide repeat protein [Bacteroides sp.]